MPSYTPVFRGPDGWFYHDRNFSQPFTAAEMQSFRQTNPDFGTVPGNQPPSFQPPSQQNWPGGSVPTFQSGDGNPFGNWWNQNVTGDGGSQQDGGMSDFWKQTLVNTGLNLVGGWLQNRAQGKADKSNKKAIEDRIRQALAALSPEHIMTLAQQFMPQMAANMSQAGQTAIQAVRSQAARTGQLEGPRALNFEAGTRAKLAGDVQSAAFERAFNVAGNQASAITGAPYAMQQPRMGYADAITNSANQAYFARAMSQQPPQQPGVPWRHPYTPGVPMYGQY